MDTDIRKNVYLFLARLRLQTDTAFENPEDRPSCSVSFEGIKSTFCHYPEDIRKLKIQLQWLIAHEMVEAYKESLEKELVYHVPEVDLEWAEKIEG